MTAMDPLGWLALGVLAVALSALIVWPRSRSGRPFSSSRRGRGADQAAYEAWARSAGPGWYGEIVGKPPEPPEQTEPEERI